jgi:hypothetical protein
MKRYMSQLPDLNFVTANSKKSAEHSSVPKPRTIPHRMRIRLVPGLRLVSVESDEECHPDAPNQFDRERLPVVRLEADDVLVDANLAHLALLTRLEQPRFHSLPERQFCHLHWVTFACPANSRPGRFHECERTPRFGKASGSAAARLDLAGRAELLD